VLPPRLPLPAFADVWTPDALAVARELLDRTMRAAERAGAAPMLEAGTLLGHVRHGGHVIPWDDDLDLLVGDDEFERCVGAIGADVALAVCVVDDPAHGRFAKVWPRDAAERTTPAGNRPWRWPFVDVFRYVPDGDRLRLYPGGALGRALDRADVLPTREATFEGVRVRVPARPDRVLDTLFPNWRIEFDSGGWSHRDERPRAARVRLRWNPAGQPEASAKRVVYTDMCADLFHAGHVNFLRQARALGDRLVVGIHGDATIASYKDAPVQTMEERVAVVAACRYVDQVVPDAPLVVSPRYLDALGVHVVCHADEIDAAARDRMYGEILSTHGLELVPYTPGISTRGLRERVLAAARNAARRPFPHGDGESRQ